jgi:hypothetical protein
MMIAERIELGKDIGYAEIVFCTSKTFWEETGECVDNPTNLKP